MSYFAVEVKCGHVGRFFYVPIVFPIVAGSKKEAAMLAMKKPRVKRNHKDAVKSVRKIDVKEYKEILSDNINDPYLRCKNKQEQKRIEGLENRLIPDELNLSKSQKKRTRNREYSFKKNGEILKSSEKHMKECIVEIYSHTGFKNITISGGQK